MKRATMRWFLLVPLLGPSPPVLPAQNHASHASLALSRTISERKLLRAETSVAPPVELCLGCLPGRDATRPGAELNSLRGLSALTDRDSQTWPAFQWQPGSSSATITSGYRPGADVAFDIQWEHPGSQYYFFGPLRPSMVVQPGRGQPASNLPEALGGALQQITKARLADFGNEFKQNMRVYSALQAHSNEVATQLVLKGRPVSAVQRVDVFLNHWTNEVSVVSHTNSGYIMSPWTTKITARVTIGGAVPLH